MSNDRDNNIVGQIFLWLILLGLLLTAEDDDNDWSVRIAAAVILSAIPIIFLFGMAYEGASDGLQNGSSITDGIWGLVLLYLLVGLAALGWFLSIVARCAKALGHEEGFEEPNAWLTVTVGPILAALAITMLLQYDLGWIHFIVIPSCYFIICGITEGLFKGKTAEDTRLAARGTIKERNAAAACLKAPPLR
jgi:hypothetical protein